MQTSWIPLKLFILDVMQMYKVNGLYDTVEPVSGHDERTTGSSDSRFLRARSEGIGSQSEVFK